MHPRSTNISTQTRDVRSFGFESTGALELTPEGLMLEKDVDCSASVVHHMGKKLDRTIIIVLALS
jgi:hypothetical protein